MKASKRGERKTSTGQQAEHSGAIEAAAFGTTAGTMLLGLLAGAAQTSHAAGSDAAAPHHGDSTSSSAAVPPVAADRPDPASPALDPSAAAGGHDTHATEAASATDLPAPSPSPPQPATHAAEPAAGTQHAEMQAADMAAPATVSAPIDTGGAQPHDMNPVTHGFEPAVSNTLDGAMSGLPETMSGLSTGIQHLTASALPDFGEIGANVSAMTATITQAVFPAPAAPASETFGLDGGGLVPVAALTAPLHVGFTGQAQADGHDAHDGAFSALGANHF